MSQYQQPQHPATAYYPGYAPEPPKDLTVMGILAFATAALATLFTVVNATIVGRVLRHLDADDLDWSVAVYALGGVLAGPSMIGGWITAALPARWCPESEVRVHFAHTLHAHGGVAVARWTNK